MHRRTLIVLIVVIVLLALPHAASAQDSFLGAGVKATGIFILDLGSDLLDLIGQLLIRLISYLGNNLQSILGWKATYGGATVYQMWKWIRDLCNMLFVVVLIGIAFGTIFNTIKSNAFHYRSALVSFIVAAILINMSLAAGQTIVWAGNQATDLVLGFMPKDVGAQLAKSLDLVALATGRAGAPITSVPSADIPTEQLTPAQQAQLKGWVTGASAGARSPTVALQELDGCLKRNEPVGACFERAQGFATRLVAQDAAIAVSEAEQNTLVNQWLSGKMFQGAFSNAFQYYVFGTFADQSTPSESLSAALSKFSMLLVRVFLLLVLTLSFGAIFLFMVIRIPAIWFLLAVSAGAVFAYAVPPARQQFSKWFKNLVGMSFFGPMYLMVIYLGLFVLSTQGSLIASGNNINDLPFISSIFGTVFFYLIAAGIFVGGAAAVTKFAFSLSPTAGAIFGAVGGKLGISEKTGFGISTVGRGIGAITGATTVARGAQTGLQERYERTIKAPLEARQKRLEEGVRTLVAGGESRQKYLQSRIDDRTKRLDQQLTKQTDRAKLRLEQAQSAAIQARARALQEGTESATRAFTSASAAAAGAADALKKLQDRQEARLRSLMQEAQTGRVAATGSNEVAIAAGNQLLKMQKITPAELINLQQRYAQISPAAQQGFIKQRNEQLQKDAKTRKYTDASEIRSFLELVTDKKEASKFIDAAKTGKNKFPAIIAGAQLDLIMSADGKTPLSVEEAIQREARNFKAIDVIKAEEHYHQLNEALPREIEQRYNRLLRQTKSYEEMLANATGAQLDRITRAKDRAFQEVAVARQDIRRLGEEIAQVQRRTDLTQQAKDVELNRLRVQHEAAKERLDDLTRKDQEPRGTEAAGGEPKEEKKEEPKK